jgi:hypothetical protein
MKIVVAPAVSLLLGLALGWLAFHGEPVVQTIETKTGEGQGRASPQKTVVVEEPAKLQLPVPAPATATPNAPSPEPELIALRAKVSELQAALEIEHKVRVATEGEKVPVPAGLAPRLRDEQQLVSAFNAALKEAGFPGQVSSVDCSEHPCIVFGTGFGARGDLEKLRPTSGFQAYATDVLYTFGFQRGSDPASRFFGVAMLPSGTETSEELKKRLAFRVDQMEEVSRPPKR